LFSNSGLVSNTGQSKTQSSRTFRQHFTKYKKDPGNGHHQVENFFFLPKAETLWPKTSKTETLGPKPLKLKRWTQNL
jgi:hypothetical protein